MWPLPWMLSSFTRQYPMSNAAHLPGQSLGANVGSWLGQPHPLDQAGQQIAKSDEPYLQEIQRWIYAHSGIHYTDRKLVLLYKRLQSLCQRLELQSLQQLAEALRDGSIPGIRKEVAHAASTNHTYFFREPEVLEFFQQRIVPSLPPAERWRIWSAAASSGEELYTLAIILAESLGGVEAARSRVAILGTDISETVIRQAEHGVYNERRMDGLDERLRDRYFSRVGLGNWRVDRELQKMAIFRRLNLKSRPWPFSRHFDVVFCRNVLYYFDAEHQTDVLNSIYQVTRPGGWLVTSVTESIRDLATPWKMITSGIYRKEG